MECETYTLAPSVIADKARRLADVGLHAQALELLQRNCVEARVYPTWVEMAIPRPAKKAEGYLKKGHKIRRGKRSAGTLKEQRAYREIQEWEKDVTPSDSINDGSIPAKRERKCL